MRLQRSGGVKDTRDDSRLLIKTRDDEAVHRVLAGLPMLRVGQLWFWLSVTVAVLVLLNLLSDILLPFLVGLALAYVLDPICDRLQKLGLSRLMATVTVSFCFVVILVIFLLLLVPLIVQQATGLLLQAPEMIDSLRNWIARMLFFLETSFDEEVVASARGALSSASDNLANWAAGMATGLISGGVAIFNLLALLVVTPIVTFFLLRDWDRMVSLVDTLLPRQHTLTLRGLAAEVDETLAGFIRGQGLVCLFLGVFYAVGLTLLDLNYALVIGLIIGILSFIPYVGSTIGLVLSVGVAFAQYDDIWRVGLVAGVFFLGQAIEGNVLTPKLVGDRVRLHPVWVMFGLLAGGALFGFVGVLLAVPVSAMIGVGIRFLISRYKQSAYYQGPDYARTLPVIEEGRRESERRER